MRQLSSGLRGLDLHERQSAFLERAYRENAGYGIDRPRRRNLRIWPSRRTS